MKYDKKKLKDYADIMVKQNALITRISTALNISRTTFYKWCEDYPEFKQAYEDAEYHTLDTSESQLFQNINDGKEPSIFFHLKCKGKGRGYVEKEVVAEIHLRGEDIRYDAEAMDNTVSKS